MLNLINREDLTKSEINFYTMLAEKPSVVYVSNVHSCDYPHLPDRNDMNLYIILSDPLGNTIKCDMLVSKAHVNDAAFPAENVWRQIRGALTAAAMVEAPVLYRPQN